MPAGPRVKKLIHQNVKINPQCFPGPTQPGVCGSVIDRQGRRLVRFWPDQLSELVATIGARDVCERRRRR